MHEGRIHFISSDTCFILSKRPYASWEDIQSAHPDLNLITWQALPHPLLVIPLMRRSFYPYDVETCWPFSRTDIDTFLESNAEELIGQYRC